MSEMKQQLSILMDSEFDMDANQHLLTATTNTQELRECWREYHLIGDVMRGDAELHLDIRHQVMQRLASEPVAFAPLRRMTRLVGDLHLSSMAATVAAVGFVAWVVWQSQAVPNQPTPAPVTVAQISTPQSTLSPESFDQYMQAHYEYAPSNNLQHEVQLTSYPEANH